MIDKGKTYRKGDGGKQETGGASAATVGLTHLARKRTNNARSSQAFFNRGCTSARNSQGSRAGTGPMMIEVGTSGALDPPGVTTTGGLREPEPHQRAPVAKTGDQSCISTREEQRR